jgi:hypothetical protein
MAGTRRADMSASNLCPACGFANAPTNTFCVNCGTPLAAAGARSAGPGPGYPIPTPTPYPGYPPAYPYPYGPGPLPPRANLSSILGGMFDVWSKNFLNFFVVFFLLALITGAIGALLSFAAFRTWEPGGGFIPGSPPPGILNVDVATLLLYAIAVVVITAIISSIVTGGMTEYAVRRHRGESMTPKEALRRGLDKFLSILGANLLLTLIVLGLILVPLLLLLPLALVAGSGSSAALAVICGLFVALVIGGVVAIFVYVSLSLYPPAIMMENERAIAGLSRSWAITKGYRWSLFGAIVITGILVTIITSAIVLPAGFIPHPAARIVASAIASGIVGAWLVILAAVAYDLIVRQPTPFFGPPSLYAPGFGVGPTPGVAPAPPPPQQQAPPPGGP